MLANMFQNALGRPTLIAADDVVQQIRMSVKDHESRSFPIFHQYTPSSHRLQAAAFRPLFLIFYILTKSSKNFWKICNFLTLFPLTIVLFSCKLVLVVKAQSFTERSDPMKNQTYRMTMLFDFYGELLTDRQKEFFDLYYNEDLSLAEIAENAGISRQGVRDVIVRAEAAMQEIEDKTGIIKRFEAQRPHLDIIESAAAEMKTINYRRYEDPRLSELADQISGEIAALKE